MQEHKTQTDPHTHTHTHTLGPCLVEQPLPCLLVANNFSAAAALTQLLCFSAAAASYCWFWRQSNVSWSPCHSSSTIDSLSRPASLLPFCFLFLIFFCLGSRVMCDVGNCSSSSSSQNVCSTKCGWPHHQEGFSGSQSDEQQCWPSADKIWSLLACFFGQCLITTDCYSFTLVLVLFPLLIVACFKVESSIIY